VNARYRFGAVLATAAAVSFSFWSIRIPDDAVARTSDAGSSERSIGPKEGQVASPQATPEGIDMSEPSNAGIAPARLAADESSATKAPAADAEPPAVESAPAATGAGLLNIESGQPLSITADELEAIELPDGRRQLLFSRSVNVQQGGLLVRSNRLEAHYAANASQPDRLVASGNVRVEQKARELSCAKATYFPGEERLECVGNARLRDGSNQVEGERIEILFAQDRIRVKGGAVVNVAPDDEKRPAATAGATP
jgi:lipopolysaccharide transport protein LptA